MRVETYPRKRKAPRDKSNRRFHVKYALVYDGGEVQWTGYYNEYIFARVMLWYNMYFGSWGGTAKLIDTRVDSTRNKTIG